LNLENHIAFDDAGKPVSAVHFDYDAMDHIEPNDESNPAIAALEVVQNGLLIAIRDGRRDAAIIRCAALARLCGLFASDADLARELKVSRSTVCRAVRRMKSEITVLAQLKNIKKDQ
jgi:hypothetical protein